MPASTAFVTDSNRPQSLWQPPPTACPNRLWGRLLGPFVSNASRGVGGCVRQWERPVGRAPSWRGLRTRGMPSASPARPLRTAVRLCEAPSGHRRGPLTPPESRAHAVRCGRCRGLTASAPAAGAPPRIWGPEDTRRGGVRATGGTGGGVWDKGSTGRGPSWAVAEGTAPAQWYRGGGGYPPPICFGGPETGGSVPVFWKSFGIFF